MTFNEIATIVVGGVQIFWLFSLTDTQNELKLKVRELSSELDDIKQRFGIR